jgi:hypothetical protein
MSMMRRSRQTEAGLASQERRRREDEGSRLLEVVPRLRSLRLEVEERRGTSRLDETKHSKLVIVERASSVFVFACKDPLCRDGEHEVTRSIVHQLSVGATDFTVDDPCHGSVGTAACGRTLHITARATYA